VDAEKVEKLKEVGGVYIVMPREIVTSQANGDNLRAEVPWSKILHMLKGRGIQSVMVEGGAGVIRNLLRSHNLNLIDSVILTIAPTWLGEGSLIVSPPQREGDGDGEKSPAVRLKEITWHQFGEDVVMCGRIEQDNNA
jgi:2,5-diamino-6-(ribosylamino)-4(3H)-pyrimidinone 5'-phosphate reductase